MRLLLALVVLGGCTAPDWSREAVDNLGFKEIKTEGYSWFGCGEDYAFHTKFSAINPNGKHVSGVVCCGWLKGCSVKF